MYDYQKIKSTVFSEAGQVKFLEIRDRIKALLSAAGACTIGAVLAGVLGDSWEALACIDRLEEIDEIQIIRREVTQDSIIVRGGAG